MTDRLTARQLNRATLERQLLLARERIDVGEAVRRVTALQAQEAASPYLALWNRVAAFDPATLDRAFASHEVVKASLMRVTLHAVHVDDYPAFHTAMQPTLRAARLNDRRYTETGLGPDDADALIAPLLAHTAEPRTSAECEPLHDEPRVWWALRHYAPLWHAPTATEPWAFGARNAYVAATTDHAQIDPDDAARHLVRRYLEAFGPASVADVAQFVLFPNARTRVRELLASMSDGLRTWEGPEGEELFDVADGTVPDADVVAPPRLLPMWDSVLLAYADRSRVLAADHRAQVVRRNGDILPTLLVDGYVAGVWRVTGAGIEARAFHPLPATAWGGLATEAAALLALLAERDPQVYSRYDHWWRKGIAAAEVRVLGS